VAYKFGGARRVRGTNATTSAYPDEVTITVDLPDEALSRLRAEAERRGISFDELLVEFAGTLPSDRAESKPNLAFIGSGASKDGISDKVDELLADGFGRS